ncbi:TetR family transcriptional regulator [Nonomuraea sp. MCN248]|uniref:TetR family transcriptional regulator n=1 Tax=Nonomuraea corallina TaxID=2989783 RepID=A0ABT4SLK5_9ACTN|nr:TetR family transcriptional regulator [Nonomuraea corallina]MDA0637835.1 TetR family transcriptional regulator [Nonomuraea corallina]
MARPARFTADQFLDAAVRKAAAAGPAAVTMSAVAAELGAPNGSIYHRFATRTDLLAEMWLRTVETFQEGYLTVLGTPASGPTHDAAQVARAAARQVVAWSRAHPEQATVLLYGADDFDRAHWSEPHLRRAEAGDQRVRTALAALTDALELHAPEAADRVTLALIDLPLALVRRHLRAGTTLPPHAEDLAEGGAAALLSRKGL